MACGGEKAKRAYIINVLLVGKGRKIETGTAGMGNQRRFSAPRGKKFSAVSFQEAVGE